MYCIARVLTHVVCVSMICDIMSIVQDTASCLQILLIIRLVFDAIAALSGFVLLNIIIGQVVHFAALTAVHDLKDITKTIV